MRMASGWKADTRLAKLAAEREGWSYCGGYYVHPVRGRYRAKDMDGWVDLCDNEAIEWEAAQSA